MAAALRLAALIAVVCLVSQNCDSFTLKNWPKEGEEEEEEEGNWALDEEENTMIEHSGIVSVSVQMPDVEPLEDDMYICAGVTLPKDPAYMVGILPQIKSDSVDRIELIGCLKSQAETGDAWSCSPDAPQSVCDGQPLRMYKWARNSCPNYLAKGEILTVGGELMRNMVLMVHYNKGKVIDDSGLILKMMPDTIPKNDVMLMMNYFGITVMTNSCDDEDQTAYQLSEVDSVMFDSYPDDPSEELEQIAESKGETLEDSDNDGLTEVSQWPRADVGVELGQVVGLDTDKKGNVYAFHRADRTWQADSFDSEDVFIGDTDPIKSDVIVQYDQTSGKNISSWGGDRFYMPHGLTIDSEDNMWLTDVAMHQVFKFPPGGADTPLLTLGESLVPGNDDEHFCKPTDVEVESKTGNFFVSDGYCNNRVMKFAANGTLLHKWSGTPEGSEPHSFSIPHSLALAEEHQMICVADRENGRIQCFDVNTADFQFEIDLPEFKGDNRVCAINYDPTKGVIYAVNCPTDNTPPSGFTIDFKRRSLLEKWAPREGFGFPHDVASYPKSLDGPGAVYVGDISRDTVWKFEEKDSVQKRSLVM
ncbi:peptidyl-glycine alpha-amidating monooxygenase B-like [Ptychodera flava]|uniref:peptidyl-glycine alpha-amidating monooxygenase B-like n=1 Tax=Ptychodera flava TaxID=63121 RepID=UPI00396A8CCF